METINLKKDRIRRLGLSFVFGQVTQRAIIIIVAVASSFILIYLVTRLLTYALIAAALTYIVIILTVILLDLLRYKFNKPDQVFVRMLKHFLKTVVSKDKKDILRQEFNLRLDSSYLKEILKNQGQERGLPQTMVDQLDEAIRILGIVEQKIKDDPESIVKIHAVQVTKSEADEELNYWRSLKAVQYLNKQKELLDTYKNRVEIQRFFITDPGELSVKALAVIANHHYWKIKTAWGIRGQCSLPITGYQNMLLISFQGQSPFKVAILGEVPQEGTIYADKFYTYWSYYDRSGEEPFFVSLRTQLSKALGELRAGTITEMDDQKIDEILLKKAKVTDQRIDEILAAIKEVLSETENKNEDRVNKIKKILKAKKHDYAWGYYAFRRVRNLIPHAESVTAVDITSVKKSLSILRQNPGYLEWQDACFKQISSDDKNRFLRRCYLIDPFKPDTVTNFTEILNDYFLRFDKEILPDNLIIYYTSIYKVKAKIDDMDEANVQSWLNTKLINVKQLVAEHAYRSGVKSDEGELSLEELRLWLFKTIARDFLYTEKFIYDYINPDAKVDQTGPDDYKFIEQEKHENYGELKKEYDKIFKFLRDQCGAKQVKNISDVNPNQIKQNLDSPPSGAAVTSGG